MCIILSKVVIITKNKRIKNKKEHKIKEMMRKQTYNKKSLTILIGFMICFLALIIRIGYIQFIKREEYSTQAYK